MLNSINKNSSIVNAKKKSVFTGVTPENVVPIPYPQIKLRFLFAKNCFPFSFFLPVSIFRGTGGNIFDLFAALYVLKLSSLAAIQLINIVSWLVLIKIFCSTISYYSLRSIKIGVNCSFQ